MFGGAVNDNTNGNTETTKTMLVNKYHELSATWEIDDETDIQFEDGLEF